MASVLGLSVIHNGPFDQRLHYNETDEVQCGADGPPPDRQTTRIKFQPPRRVSSGGIDFDLICRRIKNQYQKQKRADGYRIHMTLVSCRVLESVFEAKRLYICGVDPPWLFKGKSVDALWQK